MVLTVPHMTSLIRCYVANKCHTPDKLKSIEWLNTQQTEWCNSFIKYFDVFTKIKNNIKEIMQCKKWNYLDCLLGSQQTIQVFIYSPGIFALRLSLLLTYIA